MKAKYINAIIWLFGITKKQAAKYYTANKQDKDLLNTILVGYNIGANI